MKWSDSHQANEQKKTRVPMNSPMPNVMEIKMVKVKKKQQVTYARYEGRVS